MKVELKTILAGPQGGGQPGEVVDLEPSRAKALIAGGFASEVDEPKQPEPEIPERETATVEPEETAVSGEQRRKPRKPRRGGL